MTDFDYTGKRVVLTGGASGVGAALLVLLDDLGAEDVIVLDVKQPTGPHGAFIETDLGDKAAVDAAIAHIAGPIDVLFNNAGVADTLPADVVFTVNVLASRHLAWLGSPASSYVSGVNLNVDMGFSAAGTTGQLDYSAVLG